MTHLLLVTKELEIPPRSGTSLRTRAMARALAGIGDVDVVTPPAVLRLARGGRDDFATLRTARPGRAADDARTLATYRTIGGARTCGRGLLDGLAWALSAQAPVTSSAGSPGAPYAATVLDHTCLLELHTLLPAGLPTVVSMHNVESDLMRQRVTAERGPRKAAAVVEAGLLRRRERAARDLPTVVCTEADADRLREFGGAPAAIVARNGVDPVAPPTRAEAAVRPLELLFTGALDWGPNTSGLAWLVRSPDWRRLVESRPGLTLTVAGRRPSAHFLAEMAAAPGVRVEADVPSMRPLLDRARLGVAPLLEGGGSRIKLLEYAVSGLPSVSTYVGASGLDHLPDGAVTQVAQDPAAFCAAVSQELDAGPVVLPPATVAEVLRWYDWDAALRPLAELVARAADGR